MVEIGKRALEGWANADDVIAVDGSVDYFTAQIAKDPRDPFPYAARGLHSQRQRRDRPRLG